MGTHEQTLSLPHTHTFAEQDLLETSDTTNMTMTKLHNAFIVMHVV